MTWDQRYALDRAALLQVLRSPDIAKNGIRERLLAEKSGVSRQRIADRLAKDIAGGDVVVCKITGVKGRPQSEYRIGCGVAQPAFNPLKLSRPGALGADSHRKHQPQPAEGKITGSSRSGSPDVPPPEAPAVAAAQQTPTPERKGRGIGPAAAKAEAGDAFRINLEHDGTLLIVTDEGMLELDPGLSRRLGHFMVGTQGVWNPF